MKRKISLVTGSRAEYGILKPLIKKINQNKNFELFLIVAGMHLSKKHGSTINEIKNDGFKIHSIVDMTRKGNDNYSMTLGLGDGTLKFAKIFNKIKPDFNIILGDRDEALAATLAASHMNIVNVHIHGGDKTQAGIDEYNRHAITKMSNIHFAATQKSKNRIIKMGENPKFVFLTGSPSIDGIFEGEISKKQHVMEKYNVDFKKPYMVFLQHSVTTQTKSSEQQILESLRAISQVKIPTIAIMPNSDAGHDEIFKQIKKFAKKFSFINFYKNIPRNDFLCLIQNCSLLIGNSSSGIIEASYFGIPVVNIGIRQKDRERGRNVIDVEQYSTKQITSGIKKALLKKKRKPEPLYGKGKASEKIVTILEKIKIDSKLINKQIQY